MIHIQKEPIDTSHLFDLISPDTGALVIFAGAARADGMDHLFIETDLNEAEKEIEKIVQEACSKWGPINTHVTHRYGPIHIGEIIVLIAVAAGHRNEAFSAARYIIDELKVRVPLWKADVFNGRVSWIHGEKE